MHTDVLCFVALAIANGWLLGTMRIISNEEGR